VRIGVTVAVSRTAARSSLLTGLAIDESWSSTSLLVGEEDFVLDMRGFEVASGALVGYTVTDKKNATPLNFVFFINIILMITNLAIILL
jgi:hypothetical protein